MPTFALAIKKHTQLQIKIGSVAQLNRASDYGSEGCRFESCRSHTFNNQEDVIRLTSSFFIPHLGFIYSGQRIIPGQQIIPGQRSIPHIILKHVSRTKTHVVFINDIMEENSHLDIEMRIFFLLHNFYF